MDNNQIAQVFESIAGLLEMKGETVFTVRAYQRAPRTIDLSPLRISRFAEGDLNETRYTFRVIA